MTFDTRPVTPDRFEDFAASSTPTAARAHCWCLSHRLRAKEIEELGDGSREKAFGASAAGRTRRE